MDLSAVGERLRLVPRREAFQPLTREDHDSLRATFGRTLPPDVAAFVDAFGNSITQDHGRLELRDNGDVWIECFLGGATEPHDYHSVAHVSKISHRGGEVFLGEEQGYLAIEDWKGVDGWFVIGNHTGGGRLLVEITSGAVWFHTNAGDDSPWLIADDLETFLNQLEYHPDEE